ncbi:unnamed protein product [Closterium sp. NIES-64]|nr:unnamed protein product [Closterium sp. NIES-64]
MATLLSLPGLINLGLSLLIPPLGLLLLIPLAVVLNVYHWATLATRWLLLRAPSPALSWRYSSRDKVVVITGASSGIGEVSGAARWSAVESSLLLELPPHLNVLISISEVSGGGRWSAVDCWSDGVISSFPSDSSLLTRKGAALHYSPPLPSSPPHPPLPCTIPPHPPIPRTYMAREYARKGAALVLAARRENRLRAVAEECLRLGAADVAVQRADVSTEEGCHAVVNAAVEHYGRINVLVCNAGTAHPGLFEDAQDPTTLRSSMDIDFWGNVWPTVFAMPYLRRSHGQVVVTASVAAYLTYPRQSMYNAAKAAIVQFYATLRAEVHPEEMAITIAMPGFVHSELTSRADASVSELAAHALTWRTTHIPWWWPMLSTPEAARIIVRAAELRQRHVIVPFWYSAWLLYRLFAAQVMDWSQRVMLLGRAPSRFVKSALAAAVGEEMAEWLFRSVAAMPAKGKGKVE